MDEKALRKRITRLEAKIALLHEQVNRGMSSNISGLIPELSPIEVYDNNRPVTLMVFAGLQTQPGMPRAEFMKSVNSLDCNLCFIKDFSQIWYQEGLLGLSVSIDTTVHTLKGVLPQSTQKIVTMGASSGGYAAILFAELLRAEASIAFSPQIRIDADVFKFFKPRDPRVGRVGKFDYPFLDDFLIESNVSKHNIYVGEGNIFDRRQSDFMKKNSRVNINLIDTDQHNLAGYLKVLGKLTPIIGKHIS